MVNAAGPAAASSFARARRPASARGASSRSGVSSIAGLMIRSGVMPIWRSRSSRRGLDEARTSAT
jgi:hypothetical protein